MKFNYLKLLKRILRYKIDFWVEKVNVDEEKLLKIIIDGDAFTIQQLIVMCDVLQIKNACEVKEIFFTPKVEL